MAFHRRCAKVIVLSDHIDTYESYMHHFTRHSLFRIDLMFLKLGSPITLTSVDGAKSKRKTHTREVAAPNY
jgi:hypothetical protein